MDRLTLCAISAIFTGLTSGAGVLPDSVLAAVGDTVTFPISLTPTQKTFSSVSWTFGMDNIIITSSNTANFTAPEYEGRITLFSSGSLELRSVTQNDQGAFQVTLLPAAGAQKTGATTLEVTVSGSGCSKDCVISITVTICGAGAITFGGISIWALKKFRRKSRNRQSSRQVQSRYSISESPLSIYKSPDRSQTQVSPWILGMIGRENRMETYNPTQTIEVHLHNPTFNVLINTGRPIETPLWDFRGIQGER